MSGHDDTFSTEQIRPSNKPALQHSIGVTTSYPPVQFPLGLTQFAFGQEKNVRLKSYIDKAEFVESNESFNATIHLDAWSDTILYSAACTWLPILKPDREFQHGRKIIQGDQLVHKVTFGQEFTSIPKVVVWLSALDIEKGTAGWHVAIDATEVTTRGFVLISHVWGNTRLHYLEATWIGYPASRPNIDSRKFHTYEVREWCNPQHKTSKAIVFEKAFVRAPRVYFALRGIDSNDSSDPHLKAHVTDVTPQGMTVHLDSGGR